MIEAYLDIETTGLSAREDAITVVGVCLSEGFDQTLVQLVGTEVTRKNLLKVLHGVDVIYTYNGSRFDMPFIAAALGINLEAIFKHHDLMLDCWRHNLYGGFKAVEIKLGIFRELKGLDGWDAVKLWWQYLYHGDEVALDTLLKYNAEDVLNLKELKNRLGVGLH